jgi:hypothetical protein
VALSTINYLAVLTATVSAFVIGGFWYSPLLFGKPWMRVSGLTEEQIRSGNMGRIYGLAFLFILVMALNLAMFLNDPGTTAHWGAMAGFLAGFGWVLMGFGVVSQFEQKPATYWLINGGYLTVALTVMGLILGAWR